MSGNTINKVGNPNFYYSALKNKAAGNKTFSSTLLNSVYKDSIEINSASSSTMDNTVDRGGRRILNDDEIKYLSEKYNVEDMTIDEQEKLLLELKGMGVITKDDYENCIISYVYIEDNSKGVLKQLSEEEYSLIEKLSSNLLEKLKYESSKYLDDYLYWQEMEKEIPRYQEISKSIYDVSEILKLIVKEKD